ncbi:MAG TPA: hypothetical protein PLR50_02750, partial [Candidatus Rifleibacterium sp.]|nr:hypothetical protein [Candidatus Rifleibacterium sp.]
NYRAARWSLEWRKDDTEAGNSLYAEDMNEVSLKEHFAKHVFEPDELWTEILGFQFTEFVTKTQFSEEIID